MGRSADSDITRSLLTTMQQHIKKLFPSVDMRSALSALEIKTGGPNRYWFVEGRINGEHVAWEGRAYDAAEAKYKAWKSYLDKLAREAGTETFTHFWGTLNATLTRKGGKELDFKQAREWWEEHKSGADVNVVSEFEPFGSPRAVSVVDRNKYPFA